MGRRADQVPENYTIENFRAWTDRSRRLLAQDTLDLVQLHCPPSAVIDDDATYDALDQLVSEGVIAAYGVSVETMDQALSALRRPNLTNLQIIFNPFRLKPLDEVLPLAAEKGVAVFARVPLASGLLSGRYTVDTTFDKDDHRTYNRNGEAFDKGETFSGVPFAEGVAAADELKAALPEGVTLPAATLAWIASRPGVTSVIPGARSAEQAQANAAAVDLLEGGLDLDAFDALVRDVYDRRLRAEIHPQW
jgi:aryl-alcohol dehydrogenase-like predicted oxidoreductase